MPGFRVGSCWDVRWQMPNVKGGLTGVHVCEDDRIEMYRGEQSSHAGRDLNRTPDLATPW